MSTLYTAKAHAVGGRDGRAVTDDGVLDVVLALPKALGGGTKVGTNPEQLFAAGYAACFENAVRHVALTRKIKIGATAVDAEVGIGPRAEGGFALSVSLATTIEGLDEVAARELVGQAHQVCPYSHATRGNIDVKLSVNGHPL